ncbi:hypothetical protein G3446_10395 [Thiorhodococcus minor]|uniref:EAL domain-containing protein n=1 Tax=Thiorhodococcus minor TaxID=57489 RepID=A0A6M0K030_9GAMM|nr:hypothetical protein [Thiorhodococcus minor]
METEAQLAFLSQRDCHACQGFFLGRPMPAENFLDTFAKGDR